MASWILPKNERWGNFQYMKLPQRSFFGRIQDNIFFFRDFLTFTVRTLLDGLWSLVAFSAFASFFSRFMEAIPSYLAYSRKLFDHDMYELEAARLLYLLVASYILVYSN